VPIRSAPSTSTLLRTHWTTSAVASRATNWPEKETVADQSQGVPLAMIQELARYWATEYDWRKWVMEFEGSSSTRSELTSASRRGNSVSGPGNDAAEGTAAGVSVWSTTGRFRLAAHRRAGSLTGHPVDCADRFGASFYTLQRSPGGDHMRDQRVGRGAGRIGLLHYGMIGSMVRRLLASSRTHRLIQRPSPSFRPR